MADNPSSMPIPFGFRSETGDPLDGIAEGAIRRFRNREELSGDSPEVVSLYEKCQREKDHLGVDEGEVEDPNNLAEAGWGVIFSESVTSEIKDALQPLLKRREQEAGPLYKTFEVPDQQDVYQWLKALGPDPNRPVNPRLGIPYYLLIVAPPEDISFEFQYRLDVVWAVGRLWFPSAAEFRVYAESVLDFEAKKVKRSRSAVLFAPEHSKDRATILFNSAVAIPWGQGTPDNRRLGDLPGKRFEGRSYSLHRFLGPAATKQNLQNIWAGVLEGGPPSLLFSGGHGMAFLSDNSAFETTQGAMVCQDFQPGHPVNPDYYYSARDLTESKNTRVHGLIHFFFACYGGGWPEFDDFAGEEDTPSRISPKPMLSRLPQALLSHANGGALAVIAHVERAWAASFSSRSRNSQLQTFSSATASILKGDRVGQAMDKFNSRWALLDSELRELSLSSVNAAKLCSHWVDRNDARNYIVIGDPAVRLPEEDL